MDGFCKTFDVEGLIDWQEPLVLSRGAPVALKKISVCWCLGQESDSGPENSINGLITLTINQWLCTKLLSLFQSYLSLVLNWLSLNCLFVYLSICAFPLIQNVLYSTIDIHILLDSTFTNIRHSALIHALANSTRAS